MPITHTAFSNGCYFTLAARLTHLTGNSKYSVNANDAYSWLTKMGFIDTTYRVFDGGYVEQNCTDINKAQFSQSSAMITLGAAYMYNVVCSPLSSSTTLLTRCQTNTPDSPWKDRVANLTTATLATFFPEGVAYEISCETRQGSCTRDMINFKGYTHRWLAATSQMAPFTRDTILPVLKTSAEAAVKQCTGGGSGRACGFYWADGKYVTPKTAGVGEQMGVLAAVESLLVGEGVGSSGGSTGGTGGSARGSGNGNGAPGGNTKSAASRREVGGLGCI